MDAVNASLVYLLLRQVLQMLTQLARDGGAKDVEPLVLRHQVAVPVICGPRGWGLSAREATRRLLV
jgi:hypothetical protein